MMITADIWRRRVFEELFYMAKKLLTFIFASLCISASLRLSTTAQVRPIYDRGAVGLMQLLKRLNTTASALMIGAHPDDEDTALLAYLARGENARTAYLSLTRGDGGQNIIGPELGEALGVIRTEELLQARRLDGAEQFFTRAYDYGFSKTLDEAKSKWDEKIILCDAVRVIRNFRPLVVISQFSGTPADGHAHHQFAGYISPLAVKAAADATQCTDAGPTWQVKKFYVRHRGTGEPTLRINTGKYDPLLGRSYFEIAMEARSQHKSQEQGVLELRGDQFSSLNLVGSTAKETNIFDGIEREPTSELQTTINAAMKSLDLKSPEKSIPALAEAYEVAYRGLKRTDISTATKNEFGYVCGQLSEAIVTASGIQIDALADRESVVPGEMVPVSAKVFVPDGIPVKVSKLELWAPQRWKTESVDAPKSNTPAFVTREVADFAAFYNVTVPSDWQTTQPYWLANPREGDLFRLDSDEQYKTAAFKPSEMQLLAMFQLEHQWLSVVRPVQYRFADDIRGEIRRNIDVVPRVSVEPDQSMLIVPYSTKSQQRRVVVTVTNNSTQATSGTVTLGTANSSWTITPRSQNFEVKRSGERAAFTFDVTIPAKTQPGSVVLSAKAMAGGAEFTSSMKMIAYPHIQTHRIYRVAETTVRVIDLNVSPVKVGYIMGSGDRVQDAIRQMGFNVETISESELASGDLSRFDVIVVGIRAYQVRPDVVANNTRLLDFARSGGTLVVQYQLPSYALLAPFTTQMGPRVVDENAAVTLTDAKHAIFNSPNKITQADFEGWVQERNLYNFTNFAAEYTGLLESHDAGEAENKGGLVIAKLGKGNYVYCSYSMFRQLPAGVPGAYRLFANMLSLPKSQNRLR